MIENTFFSGECSDIRIKELKETIHDDRQCFKFIYVHNKKKHDIIVTPMTYKEKDIAVNLFQGEELAPDTDVPIWIRTLRNPRDKAEAYLVWSCVLFPKLKEEDLDTLEVGVLPSLTSYIESKSGFNGIDFAGRSTSTQPYTEFISYGQYTGLPSDEEIEEIKASTAFDLCKVKVGRYHFIITPMTRKVLSQVEESGPDEESLIIAKSCVVWPKDFNWNEYEVGLLDKVAKTIVKFSTHTIEDVEEEVL